MSVRMKINSFHSALWIALSALVVLTFGCASAPRKLEARKQERSATYTSLSPEMKALVDVGKIKVGMPMDAVYIAWGKPSQVVGGEDPRGAYTKWIYEGTQLQEYRYWSGRPYGGRHGYWGGPTLESDYFPTGYTQAEVSFQNGLVKEWRTFPAPPGR
jgi:hypothetical protein